ncbi:hypothetical protein PFISCL1PPCAC_13561, partial [Pristionchus fissidentatus]
DNYLQMRPREVILFRRCLEHSCKSFSTTSTNSPVADYVQDLLKRALIADSYPSHLLEGNDINLKQLPNGVYAGFDPTARSLHVGNLLILLNLFRSSAFDCQPIAIIGGATALVGDPSGRSSERDASRLHEARENKHLIMKQIQRLWGNARHGFLSKSKSELKCIDNSDWYKEMKLIDFLSLTRSLRIGEMLRTRAIRSRLEAGAGSSVSFPEFVYQSLQAYDWRMLAEKHNCCFQLGGSDQLGHLDIGAHYIGRSINKWAAGVCLPLLTDSAGNKIGKSTGGAGTWLDGEMTSPFHLYQFFRQLHDTDAVMMLKRCSLQSTEVIEEIEKKHSSNLGKWIAQDALAEEMTEIVHGREAVEMAKNASKALFHGSREAVEALPASLLIDVFGQPLQLKAEEVRSYGDLADRTRSDKQKGSVLMKTGAFKVNGEKQLVATQPFSVESTVLANAPSMTLVCWGKRKFQLIKWI